MNRLRHHPVSTVALFLWACLCVGMAVGSVPEGSSRSNVVSGSVFMFFLGSGLILLASWFRNRKRKKQHRPASGSSEVPKPQASKMPKFQPRHQPIPDEPASPAGESALQATMVEPLPVVPDSQRKNQGNRVSGGQFSLQDLLAMAPSEFEDFCGRALAGMGYQDMKRVGGAGDLQADLVGRDTHGRSTVVQCKRYKPGSKIGSPVIQTFIGMLNVHHQADRGVFITTADYSGPAVKLARQHNIVLLDGDDLVKIAGLVFVPRVTINQQHEVRFCYSCGAELKDGGLFCGECGAKARS